ncbi:MAG: hypothetical protein ACP5N2_04725 [Candidatus Nanoarchaeia archaeon]
MKKKSKEEINILHIFNQDSLVDKVTSDAIFILPHNRKDHNSDVAIFYASVMGALKISKADENPESYESMGYQIIGNSIKFLDISRDDELPRQIFGYLDLLKYTKTETTSDISVVIPSTATKQNLMTVAKEVFTYYKDKYVLENSDELETLEKRAASLARSTPFQYETRTIYIGNPLFVKQLAELTHPGSKPNHISF